MKKTVAIIATLIISATLFTATAQIYRYHVTIVAPAVEEYMEHHYYNGIYYDCPPEC